MEGTPGRHNLGRPLVGGAGAILGLLGWCFSLGEALAESPIPCVSQLRHRLEGEECHNCCRGTQGTRWTLQDKLGESGASCSEPATESRRAGQPPQQRLTREDAQMGSLPSRIANFLHPGIPELCQHTGSSGTGGCGSCFAGGASTGAACAGYEWCRTGRAFRRCEPSMGASDGWHSGRPDHGHRRRCYWPPSSGPVRKRPYTAGSPGSARVDPYLVASPTATWRSHSPLPATGEPLHGTSAVHAGPSLGIKASTKLAPQHGQPSSVCLADKLTAARRCAMAPFGKMPGATTGTMAVPKEPPPSPIPTNTGTVLDVDNDDELDTAAPGRASPGLGRME